MIREDRSFSPSTNGGKSTKRGQVVMTPVALLADIADFLFDPFQTEQSDVYQKTKALLEAANGPIADLWVRAHEIQDPVERAKYFTETLEEVRSGL